MQRPTSVRFGHARRLRGRRSLLTGRTNSSTRSGRYRWAMIMAPLEASVLASEAHSGAPARSCQWSLLAFSRGRLVGPLLGNHAGALGSTEMAILGQAPRA